MEAAVAVICTVSDARKLFPAVTVNVLVAVLVGIAWDEALVSSQEAQLAELLTVMAIYPKKVRTTWQVGDAAVLKFSIRPSDVKATAVASNCTVPEPSFK
jgi:hypothetical protein